MYTIEEFANECMELNDEELISIAIDDCHIITAMKLNYLEECDNEVQFELCSGYVEDGCNVCEDLIENTWAKQNCKLDILSAIEYLKNCI